MTIGTTRLQISWAVAARAARTRPPEIRGGPGSLPGSGRGAARRPRTLPPKRPSGTPTASSPRPSS